jgi:hypothetical protein
VILFFFVGICGVFWVVKWISLAVKKIWQGFGFGLLVVFI